MIPDGVFATVPVPTGERLRLEPLGPAVAGPYWRMLPEEEGLRLTGTHATFTRASVDAGPAGRTCTGQGYGTELTRLGSTTSSTSSACTAWNSRCTTTTRSEVSLRFRRRAARR